MLKPTEKIWHNGRFIAWEDAKIHVLSHVTSYGSSVFEGVRCYDTPAGPAIFRVRDHLRRLFDSAKIYRIEVKPTMEQLADAMIELVKVNHLQSCYFRPIVLRGYGDVGVLPGNNPTEVYIACWEWGKYLGEEALAQGVDVCVSSWTRIAPNTLPALAKAGANYMNSQLIRMEAQSNGYAEGIALDSAGYVSEGLRRKHFCRARRQDSHPAARRVRTAGYHSRHGNAVGRIDENSTGRDFGPA